MLLISFPITHAHNYTVIDIFAALMLYLLYKYDITTHSNKIFEVLSQV